MRRSKSWASNAVVLSAIAGLVFVVGSVAAAAINSKVIAHGGLLKGHLLGTAEGTANKPKAISFVITSKPAQTVKVDWSVVCARHLATPTVNADGQAETSELQEKEGIFSAKTPVSRPLPVTIKHPTACIVNVYGTLSKQGTELIKILQD